MWDIRRGLKRLIFFRKRKYHTKLPQQYVGFHLKNCKEEFEEFNYLQLLGLAIIQMLLLDLHLIFCPSKPRGPLTMSLLPTWHANVANLGEKCCGTYSSVSHSLSSSPRSQPSSSRARRPPYSPPVAAALNVAPSRGRPTQYCPPCCGGGESSASHARHQFLRLPTPASSPSRRPRRLFHLFSTCLAAEVLAHSAAMGPA